MPIQAAEELTAPAQEVRTTRLEKLRQKLDSALKAIKKSS
jgi:hypothetical protein